LEITRRTASRQRVASRCVAATILPSQKVQHSAQSVPEGPVLNDLSEEVRVCLANAEACAQKAADVMDAKIKQAFLDIERGWLILAQSFPIGEIYTLRVPAVTQPTSSASALPSS
jgi:hypothetical protein